MGSTRKIIGSTVFVLAVAFVGVIAGRNSSGVDGDVASPSVIPEAPAQPNPVPSIPKEVAERAEVVSPVTAGELTTLAQLTASLTRLTGEEQEEALAIEAELTKRLKGISKKRVAKQQERLKFISGLATARGLDPACFVVGLTAEQRKSCDLRLWGINAKGEIMTAKR